MEPIPEKYADTPNLWRVACELSRCKNPYKILDLMLDLAGPLLDQEKEDQP